MDNHINCPKPGCGFSTEGTTAKQAEARMLMHLQKDDHALQLRIFQKCQIANGTYSCTQKRGHAGLHTAKARAYDAKPSYTFSDKYSTLARIKH